MKFSPIVDIIEDIQQGKMVILMDDEEHTLSDWTRREIHVKHNTDQIITKATTDSILNLRRILIKEKIEALKSELTTDINERIINDVVDYTGLKTRISNQLNRVI